MLHKCANASCNAPFRRLREGKLFQVETEYFVGPGPASHARRTRPARRVEHYWLCDACSPFVTLTFDRGRGVVAVPLPEVLSNKAAKVVLSERPMEIEGKEDERARRTVLEVMK